VAVEQISAALADSKPSDGAETPRHAGDHLTGLVLTQVKDRPSQGYDYYYASYRAAFEQKDKTS
jgi:hypothetical protein